MAKEDVIELEGVVAEILPGGQFRVQLDGRHEILVYTAGKMRKNRIRRTVSTAPPVSGQVTRIRLMASVIASACRPAVLGREAPSRSCVGRPGGRG